MNLFRNTKRSFSTSRQVGNNGEDLACKFLKKNGYQILERNFVIRGGEIDVIAHDGKSLVFVEVKTRYGNEFGVAREAVTPWKLQFLQRAALFYLSRNKLGDKPYRFDLVAIDFQNNEPQIELIKNIT